jgi:hypothetical protein
MRFTEEKVALVGSLSLDQQAQVLERFVNQREWVGAHDKLAIQTVSYHQSSREEMLEMIKVLNRRLDEREARSTGLCPIRE